MGFLIFLLIVGTVAYFSWKHFQGQKEEKGSLTKDYDDVLLNDFGCIAINHATGALLLRDERGEMRLSTDDVLSCEIWEERQDASGKKTTAPFDPAIPRTRVHEIKLVIATKARSAPFNVTVCETPIAYGAKHAGMDPGSSRVIEGIQTAQRYQAALRTRPKNAAA